MVIVINVNLFVNFHKSFKSSIQKQLKAIEIKSCYVNTGLNQSLVSTDCIIF